MPGIYELGTRFFSPYYFPFVVLFVVIIFSVAGYYIYTNYVGNMYRNSAYGDSGDSGDKGSGGGSGGGSRSDNKKPEKAGSFNLLSWAKKLWEGEPKYTDDKLNPVRPGGDITVHFFTADWCPHCRKAKPTIDDFENKYKGESINGHTILINRVDCTDSEIKEVAEQINHFGVTSFPTVKIQDHKKNIFDFDSKITAENLDDFVKTVANN